ncbi:MAG: tetratricopeptide repeat protein [Sphingomicrobium sp.]
MDENLRRDQARDFVRKNGPLLIAAVVLFLAAIGGWIYWQNRQSEKAAGETETLSKVYSDIGAGDTKTVPARLDVLANSRRAAIRASALFTSAAVALQKNDRPTAISKYAAAAADKDLPEPYRELATIRQTSLEFDTLKPEQVIARMQPMAQAGKPWFGSAGELTAMALLKQGKKTDAGRMFAAVAGDQNAPQTIRQRAVQIAGTLGVDASAALSTIKQGQ